MNYIGTQGIVKALKYTFLNKNTPFLNDKTIIKPYL
jgi:hypothetical protein